MLKNEKFHIPVLLKETVELLKVEPGKKYIDATLGGGGHTQEIIKRGGIVLGIDCDLEAVEYAKSKLSGARLPASQRGEPARQGIQEYRGRLVGTGSFVVPCAGLLRIDFGI